MKRIAVVGAGWMAHVRARALMATGNAIICGVATRHLVSARTFGAEIGCTNCFDDYRRLSDTQPDAVLVEVPHEAQDGIVLWALNQHLHVLIGGTPATSSQVAEQIARLAAAGNRVVEAGYEARYMPCWMHAKELIDAGALGRLVTVRSIALWAGNPQTWYYQQQASGGMPLTHMTYCFLNPVRWIAGEGHSVSAYASRVLHTDPGLVTEENCIANILLDNGVLYSMTAGFIAPAGLPAWSVTFIGTQGALEIHPGEGGTGSLTVYQEDAIKQLDFAGDTNAFDAQAAAFLAALDGAATCRNTPAHTLGDVRIAEAIVTSVRDKCTVEL